MHRDTHLHIDRLELDLRGIPAGIAREAVATLGPALQQAIAAQATAPGLPPGAALNAGTLTLPHGATAAALRDALAERLARSLQPPASP